MIVPNCILSIVNVKPVAPFGDKIALSPLTCYRFLQDKMNPFGILVSG